MMKKIVACLTFLFLLTAIQSQHAAHQPLQQPSPFDILIKGSQKGIEKLTPLKIKLPSGTLAKAGFLLGMGISALALTATIDEQLKKLKKAAENSEGPTA